MTREEQIKEAANEYFYHDYDEVHPKPLDISDRFAHDEEEGYTSNQAKIIFMQGARWADEHPNWHPFDEKPKVDAVLGAFHEIIHGGICYDVQETKEFLHYKGNYTYPVAWMEIPKYKENE